MGALHEGHLSLIRKSKSHSDITVVSIFVNPSQFNNPADLENYPRTLEKDLTLLEKEGVDVVFTPDKKEMYPSKTQLKMGFGELETTLEGAFRPGHFNGVAIIVAKLLNSIHPTHVYFGQKDLQQVAVIKRMVQDLSIETEVVVAPIIREKDGLAMSSRNMRLTAPERNAAVILYNSLSFAKNELLKGKSWFEVREKSVQMFLSEPLAKLEYFELVKSDAMEVIPDVDINSPCAICTAAHIGAVRLIDNISLTN